MKKYFYRTIIISLFITSLLLCGSIVSDYTSPTPIYRITEITEDVSDKANFDKIKNIDTAHAAYSVGQPILPLSY